MLVEMTPAGSLAGTGPGMFLLDHVRAWMGDHSAHFDLGQICGIAASEGLVLAFSTSMLMWTSMVLAMMTPEHLWSSRTCGSLVAEMSGWLPFCAVMAGLQLALGAGGVLTHSLIIVSPVW